MTSRTWLRATLAGASFSLLAATAHASPQVVGDEACERHEVDIASFATCVGGKVVLPAADAQDDDATRVARGYGRSAALFAADARLGLPWLLVTQVFSAERTGMRHDTPTGCDGGPAGPTATVAQLR